MKRYSILLTLLFSFSFGLFSQTFEGTAHYTISKGKSGNDQGCDLYCKGYKMRVDISDGGNIIESVIVDFGKMESQRIITWFGKKTVLTSPIKSDFKIADLGPVIFLCSPNMTEGNEKTEMHGVKATLSSGNANVQGAAITGKWWICNGIENKTGECTGGLPWEYDMRADNAVVRFELEKINAEKVDDDKFQFDPSLPTLTNDELGNGFELIEKE